jgi:nicotinamide phosphoribosyltransferase
MKINPLFQTDFYKTSHYKMYPEGTKKIYSNLTPRKSRKDGMNEIVVFGMQYLVLEYLMKQWKTEFFDKPKSTVLKKYKRMMDGTLGKGSIDVRHIEDLHDLGYLPLEIKALPEGTICPIGVPCMTITNTIGHAYWLVNYLETIISCTLWQPITSATIAYNYRKILEKYALETTGSTEGVQWQGHDFSMRGMSSLESACLSGAGHLLSFTGTDTIPAIDFLEDYYFADVDTELVGASVPATEHSVMCMGEKDGEIGTFKRLLDLYPTGILSVVSDTWDLWKVCTEYLPTLKEQILSRDGKLVIRPDSGDPVDIICGLENKEGFHLIEREGIKRIRNNETGISKEITESEYKGVIELLWETFGGTINEQGYKVLDPHIGAIYGDSITLDRAIAICERLKAKGFASTNIVLGIGSFTYQYNTRDTFGFAVKATYGEVEENEYHTTETDGMMVKKVTDCREIFKDPVTDDGTKKSARGLLYVNYDLEGKLKLKDCCTREEEKKGRLQTIFLNGMPANLTRLEIIRERLRNS